MKLNNAQAALQGTLNRTCPEWAGWPYNYTGGTSSTSSFTYAPTTTERPMKDREKYLLVNRDTAAIVSRHEDEADAASEGARRAAKDGGVYLIFKAIKKVQPKPVDVESVDLA